MSFLSWCQIVCFIILVPNCPFLSSWCQIVRFYYLGAKLSAFIILERNCPLYYLVAKLSYNRVNKSARLVFWGIPYQSVIMLSIEYSLTLSTNQTKLRFACICLNRYMQQDLSWPRWYCGAIIVWAGTFYGKGRKKVTNRQTATFLLCLWGYLKIMVKT